MFDFKSNVNVEVSTHDKWNNVINQHYNKGPHGPYRIALLAGFWSNIKAKQRQESPNIRWQELGKGHMFLNTSEISKD